MSFFATYPRITGAVICLACIISLRRRIVLYSKSDCYKSVHFEWLQQILPGTVVNGRFVRVSNVSFWLQESTETSSIKCQLWIIFDVISGFYRKRLRKCSLLACMLSARWWIVRTKVLIGPSLRTVISLYQVGVARRARSTRRAGNVAKKPLRLLESVYKNLDNILNISTHAPSTLVLLEVLQTGLDVVRVLLCLGGPDLVIVFSLDWTTNLLLLRTYDHRTIRDG